jgi:hypothetical protein
MGVNTQIRLVQVTGSVVDFKPSAIVQGATAAAFGANDLSGSLQYFAQAISNINGNPEFGSQVPGLIDFPSDTDVSVQGSYAAGTQVVKLMQHDGTNADGMQVMLSSTGTAAGALLEISNEAGTSASAIKIDAEAGGLDLDAATSVSIAGNAFSITGTDSSVIQVTSSEAAEDLVIQQVGGNDSSIVLTAAGTGGDAINIGASAGGVDVQAATSLSLDAAGAVNLDSSGGSILVGATLADEQTVKVGKALAVEMTFSPSATAANEKWKIVNTSGTAGDAIYLDAAAGGVWLDAGSGAADAINIDSAGGIEVDAVTAMTFATSDAAGNIGFQTAHTAGVAFSIAANTDAGSIVQIDAGILDQNVTGATTLDGASLAQTLSSTYDLDAAGAITMDGASVSVGGDNDTVTVTSKSTGGDTTIEVAATGAGHDLILKQSGTQDAGVLVQAAGTAADSIQLEALAGGIKATVIDGQSVSLGQVGAAEILISPHGTAASEKILVENTAGTAQDAIKLHSIGGGVEILSKLDQPVFIHGGALVLSGAGGNAINFAAPGMTSGLDGSDQMLFADYAEYATFATNTGMSAATTVIGAINVLAGQVSGATATIFTGSITSNIAANGDVLVGKLAGDNANLVPTVGPQKAQVYVNGQLLMSASNQGSISLAHDYKISANNTLQFQFPLHGGDMVMVLDNS